jgi:hypothetical protein
MKGADPRTVIYIFRPLFTLSDSIYFPKQVSVRDFVQNAARMIDPGTDITEWTFGGSVISFRSVALIWRHLCLELQPYA